LRLRSSDLNVLLVLRIYFFTGGRKIACNKMVTTEQEEIVLNVVAWILRSYGFLSYCLLPHSEEFEANVAGDPTTQNRRS
jgi:hypothetical protein